MKQKRAVRILRGVKKYLSFFDPCAGVLNCYYGTVEGRRDADHHGLSERRPFMKPRRPRRRRRGRKDATKHKTHIIITQNSPHRSILCSVIISIGDFNFWHHCIILVNHQMLSSLKSGLKVPLKGNHLLRGSNSVRRASGGSLSSGELSYFERKQARKDERIRLYQAKLDRAMALKDRRSKAPKDTLKVEFQEWWQAKIAREQKLNRQARQEGKDWKIEVAVVLERLPQILPDKEDYEKEFDELQAHLAQFGKDYPKEFSASLPKDGSAPVSDEDLLGAFVRVISRIITI